MSDRLDAMHEGNNLAIMAGHREAKVEALEKGMEDAGFGAREVEAMCTVATNGQVCLVGTQLMESSTISNGFPLQIQPPPFSGDGACVPARRQLPEQVPSPKVAYPVRGFRKSYLFNITPSLLSPNPRSHSLETILG